MDLQYAPPAKNPIRVVPVILAGLLTTILALLGVYALQSKSGFNILGWHLDYVLPAGAIAVGIVASAGYGVASIFTGLKLRRSLLALIIALQVGAYFGAQYVAFRGKGPLFFRDTGKQVTFPQYFDLIARSFAWKDEHTHKPGEALGAAGYVFLGLELLGFVAGSLVVPVALMKRPYCEVCQVYMTRKKLANIAASVKGRKVKKKEVAASQAYAAEQAAAYNEGVGRLNGLSEFVAAGDVDGFRNYVESLASWSKSAKKLPARIGAALIHCRGCHQGYLEATLLTGQGNKVKKKPLGTVQVSREFVAAYVHPLGSISRATPVAAKASEP